MEKEAGAEAKSAPPGGGLPGDGNKVPLGGLEWLLAAGAGYGYWKLRDDE
jgi:hypothetical protein